MVYAFTYTKSFCTEIRLHVYHFLSPSLSLSLQHPNNIAYSPFPTTFFLSFKREFYGPTLSKPKPSPFRKMKTSCWQYRDNETFFVNGACSLSVPIIFSFVIHLCHIHRYAQYFAKLCRVVGYSLWANGFRPPATYPAKTLFERSVV